MTFVAIFFALKSFPPFAEKKIWTRDVIKIFADIFDSLFAIRMIPRKDLQKQPNNDLRETIYGNNVQGQS